MTQGAKIIKRKVGEIKNHSSFEKRLRGELIKIHQLLNGAGNWDAAKLFDPVSRRRRDVTMRWAQAGRLQEFRKEFWSREKHQQELSNPGRSRLAFSCGWQECSRRQTLTRILFYSSLGLSVGCRASCLHQSLSDEDFSLESRRGTWKKWRPQHPFVSHPFSTKFSSL